MNQKATIRALLLERGETGFTAYELIYQHGITRAAAYIYELRQEGWKIGTETEHGKTARYWLIQPPPGVTARFEQAPLWSEV